MTETTALPEEAPQTPPTSVPSTAGKPAPAEQPPAIQLDGVSKRYWKMQDRAMLLRSVLPFARPRRDELLAIRDVSLRIDQQETVGILGRNGAGKTTLLRLLAGVSQPSEGRVRVHGRVAPLLSVGVGFHQEMSGRENVYVNAMLLGLTRAEVDERFAAIVAFAELEEFIDVPVKFYSSGMFMRLGFSVAIHADPQILLVDEILAVGDIAFQLKCFDRMRDLQANGATIVIVSHSMHAIRLLCPRALLFRKGSLVFDGDPEAAISKHHELLTIDSTEELTGGIATPVTILESTLTRGGRPTNAASQDDELTLRCAVRFEEATDDPQVLFRVLSEEGLLAYSMQGRIGDSWRSFRAGETAEVATTFTPRFGGGGTFRLITEITDSSGRQILASDIGGPRLYIPPRLGTAGIGDAQAEITVDGVVRTNHDELVLGSSAHGPRPEVAADGHAAPTPNG